MEKKATKTTRKVGTKKQEKINLMKGNEENMANIIKIGLLLLASAGEYMYKKIKRNRSLESSESEAGGESLDTRLGLGTFEFGFTSDFKKYKGEKVLITEDNGKVTINGSWEIGTRFNLVRPYDHLVASGVVTDGGMLDVTIYQKDGSTTRGRVLVACKNY